LAKITRAVDMDGVGSPPAFYSRQYSKSKMKIGRVELRARAQTAKAAPTHRYFYSQARPLVLVERNVKMDGNGLQTSPTITLAFWLIPSGAEDQGERSPGGGTLVLSVALERSWAEDGARGDTGADE
jgi:hypothetical protein